MFFSSLVPCAMVLYKWLLKNGFAYSQLQRLIHLMLENLSSLLGSLKSADDASRPLDDLIPSLRKTRKLAGMRFSILFPLGLTLKSASASYDGFVFVSHFPELLDMPLKSITSAWESGELFSCNFTRTEVHNLSNLFHLMKDPNTRETDTMLCFYLVFFLFLFYFFWI